MPNTRSVTLVLAMTGEGSIAASSCASIRGDTRTCSAVAGASLEHAAISRRRRTRIVRQCSAMQISWLSPCLLFRVLRMRCCCIVFVVFAGPCAWAAMALLKQCSPVLKAAFSSYSALTIGPMPALACVVRTCVCTCTQCLLFRLVHSKACVPR